MATRATFKPYQAEFPTTNAAALMRVNLRPVLAFDTTTSETVYFTDVAPQGLTGALTCVITYMMASATTGGVAFDVALEAVSDGDTHDLDASAFFDTVNLGTATVPGTAGHIDQISVTLTNADSMAAADLFRLSVARDVADGGDTAAGDCYVLSVELRDAA
jgi:hypothetical protein